MDRLITIELMYGKRVVEYTLESPADAKEILSRQMNPGWWHRISPPDLTGAIEGDEQRYREDCQACGVENPYTSA